MSDTDTDLDRLQDVLNAIPAERDGMTIGELDGYVAALIVCPDMILPSEWLPGVWGGEHEFGDVGEAEATIAGVMGHYNRIAQELAERPEDYASVMEIDPNSGESLWEPWIDGFERSMRLRPDAWEEIALSGDEEASASISMIVALNDFYYGRSELTEEAEDELDRMAPGLIPEFVRNLNAWTKSRQSGRGDTASHARFDREDPPAFGRKVGRNEPCPCRSGRKYKRCCGAHCPGSGNDGMTEFGWLGIASGEQFVIERCKNGAMRRQRIAGRDRGVGEENR